MCVLPNLCSSLILSSLKGKSDFDQELFKDQLAKQKIFKSNTSTTNTGWFGATKRTVEFES